jgi:hypothetical protein
VALNQRPRLDVCQSQRRSVLGFRKRREDLLFDAEVGVTVMCPFVRIGQLSDKLANLPRTDGQRPYDTCVIFKAIELDSTSRRRTGREFSLDVEMRQAAISGLLELLGVAPDQVEVDPSRTLIKMGGNLWTLVAVRRGIATDTPSERRAGSKHKRVR